MMQGHGSSLQSLTETLEINHGSSTSNSAVDQSHFWDNLLGAVEAQNLPDFASASGDTSATYSASITHNGGPVAWNFGGSSSNHSSRHHSGMEETVVEHEWMDSLTAHAAPSLRLGETHLEPSNILSLESVNMSLTNSQVVGGSWFPQNFNSTYIGQDPSFNVGFLGNGGQVMESHLYKPGGSEADCVQPLDDHADPSATSSATTIDYLSEIGDSSIGASLDGRRLSCKRKSLEGVSGPSSPAGSSSIFHRTETSAWRPVPTRHNTGNSLTISGRSTEFNSCSNQSEELLNRRRVGGAAGVVAASEDHTASLSLVESSDRNHRMRLVPGYHHESSSSAGVRNIGNNSSSRHSLVWSADQSSGRVAPVNLSAESRSPTVITAPLAASSSTPLQNMQLPVYPPSVPPSFLHGPRNTRTNLSFSPVISTGRPSSFREEMNSRNNLQRVSEHSVILPAPEMRQQVPVNGIAPGAVAVSSLIGSSSAGVHPTSTLTLESLQNASTSQPRRLSDIVRRSLFPISVSEGNTQSGNLAPVHPALPTSQEMVLPRVSSQQGGQQHSYLRSALWMDRQGESVLGIPLSVRSLATASDGRNRLASEIRNFLDFVRRGEGLRFEDVVILDQSVFYGLADIHDRHRDMRLDVDNMSYEELLALEERIGSVNTGLNEEKVLKCLKQWTYVPFATAENQVEPCCICQEEYLSGEQLGKLDCGHDFHTDCIKLWLMVKNLCPICKTTALTM